MYATQAAIGPAVYSQLTVLPMHRRGNCAIRWVYGVLLVLERNLIRVTLVQRCLRSPTLHSTPSPVSYLQGG